MIADRRAQGAYTAFTVSSVTLAEPAEQELIVKASRFVATVAPVGSEALARARIAAARTLHPDASHHCYAYRIGTTMRFSDDGEPGGTAGRPMLEVLLKRDVDLVAAVVVRYFGGVKLGAGGLVRAYSGAVARALDGARLVPIVATVEIEVRVPFALAATLYRLVDEIGGAVMGSTAYQAGGFTARLTLADAIRHEFAAALADRTRGAATMTKVRR